MDIEKVRELVRELYNELNINIIPTINNNGNIRDRIVEDALQFNGKGIYKWGGDGYANILTSGVDCSGFVYSIYNHNGIGIKRLSSSDYVKMGKSKVVPDKGDLIFYGNPINHVAIYIGDGKIINHGSTPTKILDWQYKPVVAIRDIIGE